MNTDYYEKSYIEQINKRKDELIKLPMPDAAKEAYLQFFETGNRLDYERIYFSRREYLTIFSLSALLDKFFEQDRLWQVIESVLDEPTWVLPAHGSREHIEGKRQTIDLFAAETAGALGEIIYHVISSDVSSFLKSSKYISVCKKFLTEVKRRIFDIFLFKCPCDWWENAKLNWSAVCSGNVAIAAYYVRKLQNILYDKSSENPCALKLNQIKSAKPHNNHALRFLDKHIYEILSDSEYNVIMDRVTNSMICYLSSMGSDGACSEGVGYYKYGMEYFLKFYELLKVENMQENIDKIGDFHNTALFLQKVYLGGGNSVNFSDCLLKNKMKAGILCMLSSIYDDVRISEDFVRNGTLRFDTQLMETLGGEECHRWLGAYSDYVWVKKYGKNLRTEAEGSNVNGKDKTCNSNIKNKYSIFPDTQWYIRKWDSNTSFYIKGGNNDESHNHNDVGNFGYILQGKEILCDLGAGEYTRDYFSEKRYDILCNSSKGHNVPVIDGLYQCAGKMYCADDFYVDEKSVTVSFGKAYDNRENYIVRRKAVFGEDGGFSIYDHFERADKISERLITRIKPKIKGNMVILNNEAGSVCISFYYNVKNEEEAEKGENDVYTDKLKKDNNAGDESSKNISINVMEEVHTNHSGEKEKIYIISSDYNSGNYNLSNNYGKKIDVMIKLFSNTETKTDRKEQL